VLTSCYGNTLPPVPDVIRLSLTGDVDGLSLCLSQSGSSPDTVDAERHRTGLHHAAARGHDGVMDTLLSAGADPNFRDLHGNTPLHLCGHSMTLSLLMHYGADPRMRNATGVTALEMMRRRGVAGDLIEKLVEYERMYGEGILTGDYYEGDEDEGDYEDEVGVSGMGSIALRQRRNFTVPVYDVMEREPVDEDLDTTENSLRERLIAPDTPSSAQGLHADSREDMNVFTLMSGACRRQRRSFRRPILESRPASVFHEFFLSMDAKTLIIFVFSIFCLALLAAFYVTGVHMNYFGGAADEADSTDAVMTEFAKDETVKMVPLNDD